MDDRLLVLAYHGGPTRILEARTGQMLREFSHDLYKHSLALSPGGELLAAVPRLTGTPALLLEVESGLSLPFEVPRDFCTAGNRIEFAPTGRTLFACQNHILLWDLSDSPRPVVVDSGPTSTKDGTWSADGRWLATVHADQVRIWPWPGLLEQARRLTATPSPAPRGHRR